MKRTFFKNLVRILGPALVLTSLAAAVRAEEATELSQYGITWKFDRPCVVGKCGRWMSPSDPYAAQRGKFRRPGDEGRTFDAFVDAMWAAYRPTVPAQEGASRSFKWVWQTSRQGEFVPNSRDGH